MDRQASFLGQENLELPFWSMPMTGKWMSRHVRTRSLVLLTLRCATRKSVLKPSLAVTICCSSGRMQIPETRVESIHPSLAEGAEITSIQKRAVGLQPDSSANVSRRGEPGTQS
jgi:hypothetical protein